MDVSNGLFMPSNSNKTQRVMQAESQAFGFECLLC